MKVVLTGSSSGIGKAIAEHLLRQGHSVWGLARSSQAGLEADFPTLFKSTRCDVSDWPTISSAAEEISRSWSGRIDAIIACAGTQGEIGPAMACDPEKWSATVRANLDGTFYTFRAFFPLLSPDSRRAKLLCFSGGGATKARANFTAYGAAKTAIVRLVETLAEEWKDLPIDINAIAPGAINTRLTDEVLALGPDIVGASEWQAAQKQKASGGGSLEKVTGLVDFLLSPKSDGVTGRLLAAPWDPWNDLARAVPNLASSDIFTLRRITPDDRAK